VRIMKLFKRQPIICCICGKQFYSNFDSYGGFVCSSECRSEYEWRRTLYISGKDYVEEEEKNKDSVRCEDCINLYEQITFNDEHLYGCGLSNNFFKGDTHKNHNCQYYKDK
jgi:hypothetical protein